MLHETARIHEAVNTLMQSMERHEPDGQVSFVKHHNRKQGNKFDNKKHGDKKCNDCDRTGHLGGDKSCSALAVCCKSKALKKRSNEKHRTDEANQVTEKPQEDYYAFVVEGGNDEMLICVS